MKEFTFHSEVWLPRPRDEVFPFFADAWNLKRIMPPWLHCEILTPAPVVLGEGALIDYRIRVHGFPIRWRAEIVEWNPPRGFVDVQRRGPYTHWRHGHTFEERDGGTLAIDDVRYHPRGGSLANWLFVRRDIERMFAFRGEKLAGIFGKNSPPV